MAGKGVAQQVRVDALEQALAPGEQAHAGLDGTGADGAAAAAGKDR